MAGSGTSIEMVGIAWERDRVVAGRGDGGGAGPVCARHRRQRGRCRGFGATRARRRPGCRDDASVVGASPHRCRCRAVVGATWLQFALLGPSIGALGSWMALPGGHVLRRCPSRDPVGGGGTGGVNRPGGRVRGPAVPAGGAASELVQPVMVLIAAWVAGRISARRHHRAELVEHRAAQVETGAADIARGGGRAGAHPDCSRAP